jgi:hypothetical protein
LFDTLKRDPALRAEAGSPHLTADEFVGLAESKLNTAESRRLRTHLLGCNSCSATYFSVLELGVVERFWDGLQEGVASLPRALAAASERPKTVVATAYVKARPTQVALRLLYGPLVSDGVFRLHMQVETGQRPRQGLAFIELTLADTAVAWEEELRDGLIVCERSFEPAPEGAPKPEVAQQVLLDSLRVTLSSGRRRGAPWHPLARGYRVRLPPEWKVLKNVRKHVLNEAEHWNNLLALDREQTGGLLAALERLETQTPEVREPVLRDGKRKAIAPWVRTIKGDLRVFAQVQRVAGRYLVRLRRALDEAARVPRYAERITEEGRETWFVDHAGVIVVGKMADRTVVQVATCYRRGGDLGQPRSPWEFFRRAVAYVRGKVGVPPAPGASPPYWLPESWRVTWGSGPGPMVDAAGRATLTEAVTFLDEMRSDLERVILYDSQPLYREQSSRGFLVYQLLETRGLLGRLGRALEGTAEEPQVKGFLLDHAGLESDVERVLRNDGRLLEDLVHTLGHERFLQQLGEFIRSAEQHPEWISASDAEDLIIARDNLQLVLDGAEEIWGKLADERLKDAHAAARQADALLRANLSLFAEARDALERYKARFNAAASVYWWWQERLPPPKGFWRRVARAIRTSGEKGKGGSGLRAVRSGFLPKQGIRLKQLVASRLETLLGASLQLQPRRLAAASDEPAEIPLAVIDSAGAKVGELKAKVLYPPVVREGVLRLRLAVPEKAFVRGFAIVAVDLGNAGNLVMTAPVHGQEITIAEHLGIGGNYDLPLRGIEVAVAPGA